MEKFEERLTPLGRLHARFGHGAGRTRWWLNVRLARDFGGPAVGAMVNILFGLYVLALAITVAVALFLVVYALKSWIGIDLFSGFHLNVF